MKTFGEQLREFRHRCPDSGSPHGKLTQEKFAELVGQELGIESYSGAAVSDWERNNTQVHVRDRRLLLAMIKVLHARGGIRTPSEGNALLEAGNYRPLNLPEEHEVFGPASTAPVREQASSHPENPTSVPSSVLEALFSTSGAAWREMLEKVNQGPAPVWPRLLAVLLRTASERVRFTTRTVLWIGVWGVAWWLMTPSLRWPFAGRSAAAEAIGMYISGTLIAPLLIGLLIDTKRNAYWQLQGLAGSSLLRLYTHQGAGIGFNLGYFFVLPLVLFRHYLGLDSSPWLEAAAVTAALILGNMGARVVPHNLWLAYRRLRLADGAIFFVAAFSGPLWGIFFLAYYPILLTPLWGSVILLAALLLSVLMSVSRTRPNDPK